MGSRFSNRRVEDSLAACVACTTEVEVATDTERVAEEAAVVIGRLSLVHRLKAALKNGPWHTLTQVGATACWAMWLGPSCYVRLGIASRGLSVAYPANASKRLCTAVWPSMPGDAVVEFQASGGLLGSRRYKVFKMGTSGLGCYRDEAALWAPMA